MGLDWAIIIVALAWVIGSWLLALSGMRYQWVDNVIGFVSPLIGGLLLLWGFTAFISTLY